jgi:thiamine-phosphate pyrophosphorylase
MPLPFPPLYAILDVAAVNSEARIPEVLAENGVHLIQVRDKHASARAVFEASRGLVARLSPKDIRVIVNDRPDIAVIVSAAGVHVGQDDLSVETARACCSGDLWVGVSTHNLEQFQQAATTSADYIAVGPIFATATKENPDPVVGLDLIRAARRMTLKPLVAIGGITIQSAESVYRAGADSIAVVNDLLLAPKPALRAAEYIAIASRVLAERD